MIRKVCADAVVVNKQVVLVVPYTFGEVPKVRGYYPGEHHGAILTALGNDVPLEEMVEDFESCFMSIRLFQWNRPESVLHVVAAKVLVSVEAVDHVHQFGEGMLIVHRDLV